MSITHETAQTLSPFSSGIDSIREVPIERAPGQPATGVVEFIKKMSISVALAVGALYSHIIAETFEPGHHVILSKLLFYVAFSKREVLRSVRECSISMSVDHSAR
jgi:hypothetical protein